MVAPSRRVRAQSLARFRRASGRLGLGLARYGIEKRVEHRELLLLHHAARRLAPQRHRHDLGAGLVDGAAGHLVVGVLAGAHNQAAIERVRTDLERRNGK